MNNKKCGKPRHNCKIGKLTIIGPILHRPPNQTKVLKWLAKCECGNFTIVPSGHISTQKIKSCGCLRKFTGKHHKSFSGIEELSSSYWCKIKAGAKSRNIEFKITIEYAWKIFKKQKKKCALSNLSINFPSKTNLYDGTSSLDRIDSSKGYIPGNVQWVHKDINMMKWKLSQEKFIKYCSLIYKNNNHD